MTPIANDPSRPTVLGAGAFSIVFTDIEDSTQKWAQDEEGMWDALRVHNTILAKAMSVGGDVFTTAGDSFAVAFGDATAAVQASLEARARLESAEWPGIGPLKVRFSIHTGYARYLEGDLVGPAVNRCARMLEQIDGGQVVASQAVRSAANWDRFEWRYLGCVELRDFAQGEHLYEVSDLGKNV